MFENIYLQTFVDKDNYIYAHVKKKSYKTVYHIVSLLL